MRPFLSHVTTNRGGALDNQIEFYHKLTAFYLGPEQEMRAEIEELKQKLAESKQEIEELKQKLAESKVIANLLMDWEAILQALKAWDGDLENTGERVYLPGKRSYAWLRHLLRLKKEPSTGRHVYMTREENLFLYQKWVELGKKAQTKADFRRLCREETVGSPSEIGD